MVERTEQFGALTGAPFIHNEESRMLATLHHGSAVPAFNHAEMQLSNMEWVVKLGQHTKGGIRATCLHNACAESGSVDV